MIDFGAVGQSFDLLFSNFGPWLVVVPGIVLGLILARHQACRYQWLWPFSCR